MLCARSRKNLLHSLKAGLRAGLVPRPVLGRRHYDGTRGAGLTLRAWWLMAARPEHVHTHRPRSCHAIADDSAPAPGRARLALIHLYGAA